MSEHSRTISTAELADWVQAGLITSEQMTAIQAFQAARAPAGPEAAAPAEPARRRLSLVNIAYYFGGFMILLAYVLFMLDKWNDLEYGARLAISVGTILVLLGVGHFLWRKDFRTPGGLLLFAATALVPLFLNTILRMIGWWPEHWSYNIYYSYLPRTWIPLEIGTIIVTLLAIWWIRYPLLTLLGTFWIWFLAMDISRYYSRLHYIDFSVPEQIISIVLGLLLLLLGYTLQSRNKREYSFWLYLSGHLLTLIFFTIFILHPDRRVEGVIYFVLYLAFIVCSVWLQQRIFLVFGAIGCYIYMGYLATEIFKGTAGIIFALAGLGLLMVLTGVGYQKFARPWLEKLFKRGKPIPAAPPAQEAG